jgi:DNA-binding IclR family transcriptional regulator
METILKSAPLWSVPDGTGVPNLATMGTATSHTLRGNDRPVRVVPGSTTREYRIPNLARACQVLRLFAASDDQLSSSAVARKLKMPRTTVLRILHTLAAERFLQRRGFDFAASVELRTGLRSMADTSVRSASVPVLNELSQITGESAHLALLAGDKAVVVESSESQNPSRSSSWLRAPLDLHCSAIGKVFLATGSQPCLEKVLAGSPLQPRTRRTITNAEALRAECARIVKQGYAVDNEEYEDGMRCLAAPVWGRGGVLIGAIGISASAATLVEPRISDVASQVAQAANRLSGILG